MQSITFNFNNEEIKIATVNETEYFCVADVGKILELKDIHRRARTLPEKGRLLVPTPTSGGMQDTMFVDEKNLYRLIFQSKKKESIKFQDWVFDEVIPQIRKTGKYSIPERLKKQSTDNRNLLTDSWKECGITKPHHFIQLTLQEYKALNLKKGKRKKDMTRKEILLLNALESMESLKLFGTGEKDYYECRDSMQDTAIQIDTKINNHIEVK